MLEYIPAITIFIRTSSQRVFRSIVNRLENFGPEAISGRRIPFAAPTKGFRQCRVQQHAREELRCLSQRAKANSRVGPRNGTFSTGSKGGFAKADLICPSFSHRRFVLTV